MSDLLHFETCDGRDPCSCDREARTLNEIARVERERDDALARLTTAETERDRMAESMQSVEELTDANDRAVKRAAAAEARVEAAEKVIEAALAYREAGKARAIIRPRGTKHSVEEHARRLDAHKAAREELDAALARAALACPPQQRGE